MAFKIAKVLDSYKVVMNAGSNQKISNGQKYLIYQLSDEEIIDPDTNKSLGFLEIVKGTGTVTHVQDNMATLEACEREKSSKIIHRSVILGGATEEVEASIKPFDNPQVGDLLKRVN